MQEAAVVSQWGNSKGIRIPIDVLKKAQKPSPKSETLEYLFKDYDGGEFNAELIDLGEVVGNEKW